jgi:plasmid stabilization system protein ParE
VTQVELAQVELARSAVEDLRRIILTHSLPPDTLRRVRASLEPLRAFPRLGQELEGRWHGFRFVVGPWRWMLMVYRHIPEDDRVVVVTVQDARTSSAVTTR